MKRILLTAILAAFSCSTFAQFQGDVRLTRTTAMTPSSSQGVLYASTTQGGVFRGSGSSADLAFVDRDGNIITSIGPATFTNNATTWTVGNNFTETRATQQAPAGTLNAQARITFWTADPGGTSDFRAYRFYSNFDTGNNAAQAIALQPVLANNGTSTIVNGQVNGGALQILNSGNITTGIVFNGTAQLTSSGNGTTIDVFRASAPTLSSTGAITTHNGFHAGNLGHATLVTNAIGFQADTMTAAATLTASFRSQQNSGTGAWGFLHSGTANNAFNGSTKFGATTAPTQVIDVAGNGVFTGTVNAASYGTASNCSDGTATPADCGSASAGSVIISAAATAVVVNTTAVTANSQIFVQEDSSLGTRLSVTCNTTIARTYVVTARTAGTSFTITASAAPVTNPACLSYRILN